VSSHADILDVDSYGPDHGIPRQKITIVLATT
jgi:hypothetical protein